MVRVLVSGCFDLVHPGHCTFLQFARSQGDHLTVSIASDDTSRRLKREPILCEHDRYLLVSALRCVDHAFVCRGAPGNQDCFSDVRSLRPDVWVVTAGDAEEAAKRALAQEVGARIVLYHRADYERSTTNLLERLSARIVPG
jgi:cytidyltransferase-like protein